MANLTKLFESPEVAIYQKLSSENPVQLIASTPQTRAICNDPVVAGIEYTDLLRDACTAILPHTGVSLNENNTVVVNILRGGLNFGLRDALAKAFGWNRHTTCFLSAQRARNEQDPESWHITENAYRKLYFPRETTFVLGDVVATGTSLRYALTELINEAKKAGTELKNILFFTYGGSKAAEILSDTDRQCRELFPGYQKTTLVYLEGCFTVPDPASPLTIRLTGTDLVRRDAEMAPEFVDSQYENPAYPVERCIIYDAGSRAFWVREFAEDVVSYWKQVLELAGRGVTYSGYLAERMPEVDAGRFGELQLNDLAVAQIDKMQKFLA